MIRALVLALIGFGATLVVPAVFQLLQRSVTFQALHFFGRLHDEIPVQQINSSANWLAEDLERKKSEWLYELSPNERQEILHAVKHVMLENITLRDMTKDDFRLPIIGTQVSKWRNALDPVTGMGVVVIKGIPVAEMTQEEAEVFWWGFGLLLGSPGAQNSRGDLLGHVRDEFRGRNEQHGHVRQYRTNEHIKFHCDVADVVGLLCLQPGKSGGVSRIASSVAIFNELMKRRPDLVPLLFQNLPLDTRGDGGVNWIHVQPSTYHKRFGTLRTFWHSEYLLTSYLYDEFRREGAPEDVKALITAYDEIAEDPRFSYEMIFEVGDVQLISNHVVIHGRTAFQDGESEGESRHVIRLWLSMENSKVNLIEKARLIAAQLKVGLLFLQRKIAAKL